MADTTDLIYEKPEREPFPDHTGHAVKVFAIHMGVFTLVCVLIGVFWDKTAMWVLGGVGAFFMIGWHLVNIDKCMGKDKKWYNERMGV